MSVFDPPPPYTSQEYYDDCMARGGNASNCTDYVECIETTPTSTFNPFCYDNTVCLSDQGYDLAAITCWTNTMSGTVPPPTSRDPPDVPIEVPPHDFGLPDRDPPGGSRPLICNVIQHRFDDWTCDNRNRLHDMPSICTLL
jgi:hypothetical protein